MDSVRFALAAVVGACFVIAVFAWLLGRHESRRIARLEVTRATDGTERTARR